MGSAWWLRGAPCNRTVAKYDSRRRPLASCKRWCSCQHPAHSMQIETLAWKPPVCRPFAAKTLAQKSRRLHGLPAPCQLARSHSACRLPPRLVGSSSTCRLLLNLLASPRLSGSSTYPLLLNLPAPPQLARSPSTGPRPVNCHKQSPAVTYLVSAASVAVPLSSVQVRSPHSM